MCPLLIDAVIDAGPNPPGRPPLRLSFARHSLRSGR
ncbi:hypothetical protein IL54_4078 [Sphingobium sp. ba1]|nr:hypothetical protein IL54_4078 [Sphingobium sp. ba1]